MMTLEEASRKTISRKEIEDAQRTIEKSQNINEYHTVDNDDLVKSIKLIKNADAINNINKIYQEEEKPQNEILSKAESVEPTHEGPQPYWQAFMGHIAHTEFEYLDEQMKKFEAPYVISAEVGKYEHFHFLTKITNKQYHNFCKRVFKDRYKLLGRATKNKPRQYGKVKDIKDLSRMMAYTLKDKNYKTNIPKDELETILKKKLEEVENTKTECREIKEKMLKYVDEKIPNLLIDNPYQRHEKVIRISIIDFMITQKINIIRTTIERYYWYYVTNTEFKPFQMNSKEIYDEIYDIKYA
jgi:hypothetical protein